MAPAEFRDQTSKIIECFFELDDVETDGAVDDCSTHDDEITRIAVKLRDIGDDYDETVIRPLVKNLQKAAADQVIVEFSKSVDALSKTWVMERSEVVPEKYLLKASVAIGVYVKRNCPDMITPVKDAMQSFITNQLAGWVSQQGGWDNASCS